VFGSVALDVQAELPVTGTYTGDIFLLYGDGETPARVPLTVTRAPKPLTVVVKELLPVEATEFLHWTGGSLHLAEIALQGARQHGWSLEELMRLEGEEWSRIFDAEMARVRQWLQQPPGPLSADGLKVLSEDGVMSPDCHAMRSAIRSPRPCASC
jgi:hypothetical protein